MQGKLDRQTKLWNVRQVRPVFRSGPPGHLTEFQTVTVGQHPPLKKMPFKVPVQRGLALQKENAHFSGVPYCKDAPCFSLVRLLCRPRPPAAQSSPWTARALARQRDRIQGSEAMNRDLMKKRQLPKARNRAVCQTKTSPPMSHVQKEARQTCRVARGCPPPAAATPGAPAKKVTRRADRAPVASGGRGRDKDDSTRFWGSTPVRTKTGHPSNLRSTVRSLRIPNLGSRVP